MIDSYDDRPISALVVPAAALLEHAQTSEARPAFVLNGREARRLTQSKEFGVASKPSRDALMPPHALVAKIEEGLGEPDAVDAVIEQLKDALAPLPRWHANARLKARHTAMSSALKRREMGLLDQWPAEAAAAPMARRRPDQRVSAGAAGAEEDLAAAPAGELPLARPAMELGERDGVRRAPPNPDRRRGRNRRTRTPPNRKAQRSPSPDSPPVAPVAPTEGRATTA